MQKKTDAQLPMNKKKPLVNIPPVPAVLLSIISVQGGAAIAKGIFPVLGAASTALIRIGLSAVILMMVNRPNLKLLTAKQWKAVIPYGICLGAMNLVFYLAIKRIPLGLGVTLEFVGPLMLAIFGSKRIVDYLWVLLAAAGIALIAPWGNKGIDLIGIFLALAAGGFWASYIVLGGRISKLMNGGDAVTVGMLFATLVVLPFGIGSGGLGQMTPVLLLLGIALALLSSAIPFTLEISALRQMPARTFSILMSIEPAVAALSGLVLLDEHLNLYQWIAVALVIIASAGATLTAKKALPAEPVI
ncbi:EamA family transporter [Pedobacter cryoconitis]|uniref:Inner membrane transporter RhtA n=1 Tax=Pedobacter cryoconitis TaxID=188932 RepID=A0A7X0MKJ7_9SPHI|nr:DMT family transporter [Pedobacter cryoconitis]MBB6502141.1 inner membrane transporter RhtA [Pedobacter cryoconitis]